MGIWTQDLEVLLRTETGLLTLQATVTSECLDRYFTTAFIERQNENTRIVIKTFVL